MAMEKCPMCKKSMKECTCKGKGKAPAKGGKPGAGGKTGGKGGKKPSR